MRIPLTVWVINASVFKKIAPASLLQPLLTEEDVMIWSHHVRKDEMGNEIMLGMD